VILEATYSLRVDFYPSYELASLPIEKTDTTLSLDTEQDTATKTLSLKADIDR